ncbi:MAG: Ig-like domain-containing protein [Planctomycetota bacterium]
MIISCGLAAACSHNSATTGAVAPSTDFAVLSALPAHDNVAYLNDPVRITFKHEVDPSSVNLSTVVFQALDGSGRPNNEVVAGIFQVSDNGHQLSFQPRLPTSGAFATSGFRPGRTYEVTLPGGEQPSGAVVRDLTGGGLQATYRFSFNTPTGPNSADLFRNPLPGGPRRTAFDVSIAASLDDVPLGLFGAPPLEVRLHLDQALNPSPSNVPVDLDTDPLVRDVSQRGRVFLEYADRDNAAGEFTWIPADVEIERNDANGATIVLRPVGVLPNNATVRAIVEAGLEDIAGESNVGASSFDRVFGTFRTAAAWQQQWNGIVEQFDASSHVDPNAIFAEAPAEVGSGYVRAGFDFDGNATTSDFLPGWGETVLNTNLSFVTSSTGAAVPVTDGVFYYRNVVIPAGATVIGRGQNPLVFLCNGKVTIGGTLSVRGGDGARAPSFGQYLVGPFDSPGGVGVCGGGNGGSGSPGLTVRNPRGSTGQGARQVAGTGGRGGYLACTTGCYTGTGYNGTGGGSGGGGGTLATQGDPNYRGASPANIQPNTPPTAGTAFQQKLGFGGSGCSGSSGARTAFLLGGEPGDRVFVDARSDNDFWGSGIDLRRNLRIVGELALPVGGSGGGGGGDASPMLDCSLAGNNPAADPQGGGGGGGGGVVVIKALDEIWITHTGSIVADGGHGGGGDMRGACGEAGGGGGGAGGMVVLMSAKAIRIEAHGSVAQNRFVYGSGSGGPFVGNDYSFAISADGGVCKTGTFGAVYVAGKYPASGASMLPGAMYDTEPVGGLGGMGIVQLMAPGGDNSDGTNTRLDDSIYFYLPGALAIPTLPNLLGAAAKRQLLAWRGFADANGIGLDDFGQPTGIGDDEGDIRPAPVLLPVPFGARSRARSRWIDTGRSDRRAVNAPDAFARGLVVANGAEVGPRFEFAGLDAAGFAQWVSQGANGVGVDAPTVVPLIALASAESNATFVGAPAYRLRVVSPLPGPANRFVSYEAELATAGARLAGFRILAHDGLELLVAPGNQMLPSNATHLRIVARFFDIVTNGNSGLPWRVPPGAANAVPSANVRFGFAFHTNPNSTNPLVGRYPSAGEQSFVHDLNDPNLRAWVAANQPRFVQWDVLFDLAYDGGMGPTPLSVSPRRPELHFLRLPFRF